MVEVEVEVLTLESGPFSQRVHVGGGQFRPGVVDWGEGEAVGWVEY